MNIWQMYYDISMYCHTYYRTWQNAIFNVQYFINLTKEMFYLMMHSTPFIYSYDGLDIWSYGYGSLELRQTND